MVSISVVLPTARDIYGSIIGLDVNLFEPTLRSLNEQSFKDFELVFVDCLYESRSTLFKGDPFKAENLDFPIKHIPVHPNHRFWLDRKRWNICGTLNSGIIAAEGELLIRIDDASEFDSGYLQRFWEGYESGYFPLAMHTRYRGGKQAYHDAEYRRVGYEAKKYGRYGHTAFEGAEAALLEHFEEGAPIRDTRWPLVEAAGGRAVAAIDQFYGYSSFSIEAALKVNGFNEMLDGQKSLDDVDFGVRLATAGYAKMFLLSTGNTVIEHEHGPVSDIIDPGLPPLVCNYAVMKLFRERGWFRANERRLTEEELDFVREESLRTPCSPEPGMYVDDCRGPLFSLWASRPNVFDLREERLD